MSRKVPYSSSIQAVAIMRSRDRRPKRSPPGCLPRLPSANATDATIVSAPRTSTPRRPYHRSTSLHIRRNLALRIAYDVGHDRG